METFAVTSQPAVSPVVLFYRSDVINSVWRQFLCLFAWYSCFNCQSWKKRYLPNPSGHVECSLYITIRNLFAQSPKKWKVQSFRITSGSIQVWKVCQTTEMRVPNFLHFRWIIWGPKRDKYSLSHLTEPSIIHIWSTGGAEILCFFCPLRAVLSGNLQILLSEGPNTLVGTQLQTKEMITEVGNFGLLCSKSNFKQWDTF